MSKTLFPGYTEVDSFNADDYEIEEEVEYITLDLGSPEPTLVPSSTTYRLIGLDTPTPYLQLAGTIFKGQHEQLLGTELLFTDEKDSRDWSKRSIDHMANTSTRIQFKEVALVPIAAGSAAANTTKTSKLALTVDRLTGKEPPPKQRGGRKKKVKVISEEEPEAKAMAEDDGGGAATPPPRELKPRKVKSAVKGKGKGKAKATEEEVDEDTQAALAEFLDVGSSPVQTRNRSGTTSAAAAAAAPLTMLDMEGLHAMDDDNDDGDEYNPMDDS